MPTHAEVRARPRRFLGRRFDPGALERALLALPDPVDLGALRAAYRAERDGGPQAASTPPPSSPLPGSPGGPALLDEQGRVVNAEGEPVIEAATAATLANPVTAFPYAMPALGSASGSPPRRVTSKRRNTVGRPVMFMMTGAIISAAGQNGHLMLQVAWPLPSPDEAVEPPDANFVTVGQVACRNNLPAGTGGEVASGGQLSAIIPTGGWWRLRLETITGYAEPGYAYVGSPLVVVF